MHSEKLSPTPRDNDNPPNSSSNNSLAYALTYPAAAQTPFATPGRVLWLTAEPADCRMQLMV